MKRIAATWLVLFALGTLGVLGALGVSAPAQTPPSAAPAARQQVTIHLDAAKSKIQWVLKDTLHTVNGTFRFKGGLITFNQETGVADGELLVEIASGATGNTTRDNKMKTQVLEAQRFPTAFFHPTLVTGKLDTSSGMAGRMQHLQVQGTFNIHGADHPLTLNVDAAMQSAGLAATTHFLIPYVAWGMRDPSLMMLRVGKQVDVTVVAQGTIDP